MLKLGKYSFGMGDRFAHQGIAQLRACVKAKEKIHTDVVPVWNKSHREHTTIGSEPGSLRKEADEAVAALGWEGDYHVDADHINLTTVDGFIESSDFYTIDVADAIGRSAGDEEISAFVERHPELSGTVRIPGIERPFEIEQEEVARVARNFLFAVKEAGSIYRHIARLKGEENFITEVSMDETDSPQTPPELLIILAAIADEKIPAQTIAPKFTGRFNKGVDYEGDLSRFSVEFSEDLAVIANAVADYGLPEGLKLSVHSGSDKFSIYGPMRRALEKTGAGVHIKTAGTTWLEELIGLAEAGSDGLVLAKEVYRDALRRKDALCAPYAAVIDVDETALPSIEEVGSWSGPEYAAALRHDPNCDAFNPHLRQLLHVGYKVAAEMGEHYLTMLEECEETIGQNVTENLYERHIVPLFGV